MSTQPTNLSMAPHPLELQSRFQSGEECFEDPHAVRINVPVEFLKQAQKAIAFMEGGNFNSVTVQPAGEFELLDKDGKIIENELLRECRAEVKKTGGVRFVFPFRHARDQGWTQDEWSVNQLAALAFDPPRKQESPKKHDH